MFSKSAVRVTVISFLSVLLGACSATLHLSSPRPVVDPGASVTINSEFNLPNQAARVYLQNGKSVAWSGIDRWTTYCSVLMDKIQYAGEPQLAILPGDFEIVHVRQRNDGKRRTRLFVASQDAFLDWPANVTYEVTIRLASPQQPDVRALICAKRDDRPNGTYPSLSEIRATLGNLVNINTPQ